MKWFDRNPRMVKNKITPRSLRRGIIGASRNPVSGTIMDTKCRTLGNSLLPKMLHVIGSMLEGTAR